MSKKRILADTYTLRRFGLTGSGQYHLHILVYRSRYDELHFQLCSLAAHCSQLFHWYTRFRLMRPTHPDVPELFVMQIYF